MEFEPPRAEPNGFLGYRFDHSATLPMSFALLGIPEAKPQMAFQNVARGYRTHDLRIMRPTRHQLRYCRTETKISREMLVREKRSYCATPERRNRTPACFHAPWVGVTPEHQPESPRLSKEEGHEIATNGARSKDC